MKRYTATEAANELGIDAKTLRRLLRNPASGFEAPGSGGSWSFSTADLPKLKDLVADHNNKPTGKGRSRTISDAPGLSVRDARDPAKVRAITEERVDRLEAALKASGLHISQMRERDTFRPVQMPQSIAKGLGALIAG